MSPVSSANQQLDQRGCDSAASRDGRVRRDFKLRILVVDDNADAAASLGRLLGLLGHDVRVVHSGVAAVAELGAFAPRAVLLDLGMPGMDGFKTAECIRSQPGGELIWLIAVTGWGQDRDRQRTEAAGFAAHLIKPVNVNQLEAVLLRIGADA
jgi:CheY-like chemotaxis protein